MNDLNEACLTDFGLVTALYNTGTLTATGTARGTTRWMSPELFGHETPEEDEGRPTVASDLYALAMVLWEASHLTHEL